MRAPRQRAALNAAASLLVPACQGRRSPQVNAGAQPPIGLPLHACAHPCSYQDGDGEDLEIQELLRWLQAPPGKQAACGRRRGRLPKQAGGPYNQATGGLSRQATLTGGRRLRQAPPRTASSPALGAGLAPLALEPQAVAAAQEEGGYYAAGGAGHERGATAYDSERWQSASASSHAFLERAPCMPLSSRAVGVHAACSMSTRLPACPCTLILVSPCQAQGGACSPPSLPLHPSTCQPPLCLRPPPCSGRRGVKHAAAGGAVDRRPKKGDAAGESDARG